MDRFDAIRRAYQIATLTEPTDDVMRLLLGQTFERVLELLLILRQSSKPVKSPLNFLRRAIDEGWTPETPALQIDRKMQNRKELHYLRKGYSPEEARAEAMRTEI